MATRDELITVILSELDEGLDNDWGRVSIAEFIADAIIENWTLD